MKHKCLEQNSIFVNAVTIELRKGAQPFNIFHFF